MDDTVEVSDMRAQRVVLLALVAALLVWCFALQSCATAKTAGGAVSGAGLGLLLGPAGAVAGAGLGAAGGGMWAENGRLQDEIEKLVEKNARANELDRARIADLERRVAAIPAAPAANPRLTPPVTDKDVSWLRETPFQTTKRLIGWGS